MTTIKELDERIKETHKQAEYGTEGEMSFYEGEEEILKQWKTDKQLILSSEINFHQKECPCSKEECFEAIKLTINRNLQK
jgi:hypothetical protein